MGISLKVVFNRVNTKLINDFYSISIRITLNRKTDYLPTEIKIKKEHWSGKDGKWVSEKNPLNHELNKRISNLKARLEEHIWKCINNSTPFSIQSLKEFHKKKTHSKLFNDFLDNYIKTHRFESLGTLKTYKTFQKHINEFNPQIRFSEITENLIKKYFAFLSDTKNLKPVSIKKDKDKFGVVLRVAFNENMLDSNPFERGDFKIKSQAVASRVYLTQEEIFKIKDLDLSQNPFLDRHRWHFIFLCLSGLYYNDFKKLKWTNLEKHDSGKGYYLKDTRFKNDKSFIVPIYKFETTTFIIEKYGNKASEKVFPDTIEDQPFNRELKKIAELAKIDKNLFNKVGRHTYAQLLMKMGIERQFLSKMLGHTKEETTQSYYAISSMDLDEKIKDLDYSKLGL